MTTKPMKRSVARQISAKLASKKRFTWKTIPINSSITRNGTSICSVGEMLYLPLSTVADLALSGSTMTDVTGNSSIPPWK